MKKSGIRKKRIIAFGVVDQNDVIWMCSFNTDSFGAQMERDHLALKWPMDKFTVVPCTITYAIPKRKGRK
jgi:hypothetical protein